MDGMISRKPVRRILLNEYGTRKVTGEPIL